MHAYVTALLISCSVAAGTAQAQPTPPVQPPDDALAATAAPTALTAHTGATATCDLGAAGAFPCEGVYLHAFLPIEALGGREVTRTIDGEPRTFQTLLNDVWGWTDPATGREYALVGRTDGTAFVDVTDPVNPRYLGDLPFHGDEIYRNGIIGSAWRDVKVYADHAFIVADNAGPHGMQVFDLTQLRDVAAAPVTFAETAHYAGFGSAHNIVVNEATGFAYAVGASSGGETCGGGLHMIDVQDPLNPAFAGCFADPRTGRSATGYTHDAQCVLYDGPDADYQGREICVGANETALSVADVTDKQNPVAIAVAAYPDYGYVHQGWLSDDHRYFYQDDELDERNGGTPTRTLIWDLDDLDDPILAGTYTTASPSIDHNQYVHGSFLYQANYASGLRILDLADPVAPHEIGYLDTYPSDDATAFQGAWSVYPFFESGALVVSSIGEGLFVAQRSAALAVELVGFEARVQGGGVELRWEAASEVDHAGYEVQLRPEAAEGERARWQPVGFVAAAGGPHARHAYRHVVEGLAPGAYRFRLKLVGRDGGAEYAPEVTAEVPMTDALTLSAPYPNPAGARTAVRVAAEAETVVQVAVYDLLGREVLRLFDGPLAANRAEVVEVDVSALPAGTYVVRLAADAGVRTRPLTVID